ncbi:hypothetical protein Patl1_36616 [Pistacia atlantica]|nr:hypothetical protein Patl1_36616 [Pistacia atlantica]
MLTLIDLKFERNFSLLSHGSGEVLHGLKGHKSPFKALIVAEYNGVQVKLVDNFKLGVTNKSPEFLKLNPIGKVPVLETPDGPVFESNAIARYDEVYPSSISIEGTLGNFRLRDMSLGAYHCWGWLCDIHNPGVESLIKF